MRRKIIMYAAAFSFCLTSLLPIVSEAKAPNANSSRRVSKTRTLSAGPSKPSSVTASLSLYTLVKNGEVSVGPVHADSKKKVFYWPGCKKFDRVAVENKLIFGYDGEAKMAGFKPAKDCQESKK